MKNIHFNYLLFISFISAMGGFLFGYDWVVIGGAKIFYEPFFGIEHSALLKGWAMSSALLGCLAGTMFSGKWSDAYGRKKMLIVASVFFTVSAYGTGAVDSFWWFIFYRILGGVGIGIASNISPVYIAEITPSSLRGRYVSLNQLTIVLGILAAQIANWLIGDYFLPADSVLTSEGVEHAWRWMFWAELIPAALFFVLSFIIPESPRWLAVNRCKEQAFVLLQKIQGAKEALRSLTEMEQVAIASNSDVRSLLKQPRVRKILYLGIFLAVFQQWCGINVIFNYAHEIFTSAGYGVSDVLMNIVITGVTNVVFTFVALFTVDRWGRRKLMWIGAAGLSTIYLIMSLCYYLQITGLPLLILVVMAIACYAMSLAPVVWVVLSEIFPLKIRGLAIAVSTFFLWTACFLLTYTFPLLNEWLKASGTFGLYGIICIIGFVVIHRYLPETKGKSLEEIEKELIK